MNEKQIKEIFRQLDKTTIPKKEKILSECENAFEKREPSVVYRKNFCLNRRMLAVCAAVIMMISISALSFAAIAAEQQQYQTAVAFFEENDIPTEGYTRSEIKSICKDIVSGSFTYELTPEAIKKSNIGNTVVGEIIIEELSPEELKELWEKKAHDDNVILEEREKGFRLSGEVAENGISFVYKNDEANGETVYDVVAILEKYADGKLEWSKTFTGASIYNIAHTEHYIAFSAVMPNAKTGHSLVVLSHNGDVLWKASLDNVGVVIAEEKTVSVLSNADLKNSENKLIVYEYSIEGDLIRKASSSLETFGSSVYTVLDAIKLEDGFIMVFASSESGSFVAKSDINGCIEAKYELGRELLSHKIADIAYTEEELYISGYYMPSKGDKNALRILEDNILEADGAMENAILLEKVRKIYSAFLFIADIETGEIKGFHKADGALGDVFEIDKNGNLVWNVKAISAVSFEYTPYYHELFGDVSTVSLNIAQSDNRYIFSVEGELVE